MIRISQVKLPVGHKEQELKKKAAKLLRVKESQVISLKIVKKSIDARKKEDLLYIYTIDAQVEGDELSIVKRVKNPQIVIHKEKPYCFPDSGSELLSHPPVIIGCGPAGLFCGLMLAKAGYRPVLLERGEDVDARKKRVERFWRDGLLSPDSNVQFGEGGAGTFSDGKLNTMVKDSSGRNKKVLELLVEAGADPSIIYENKPHIGTDVLCGIVKHIREEIRSLGGEVRFGCKVTDLQIENGAISGVWTEGGERQLVKTNAVVLAIGHSARDTFELLYEKKIHMEAKAFAVGLRIQHPQAMINKSQYGMEDPGELGAASYKLTMQTAAGRGVYSFCMCPGGFVVNASSEDGRLAVNGMSNHKRDGINANSALIVTVTPEDFADQTSLGGVAFQRRLEEAAYACGKGKIPVQLYKDFKRDRESSGFGEVEPAFMGQIAFGNLRTVLPEVLSTSLIEGIESFGKKIKGFNHPEAILAGIESRTSSPVRIPRDEKLESNVAGLYPCGEGAGYAGGITSAAMDGIKVAEELASRFARFAG